MSDIQQLAARVEATAQAFGTAGSQQEAHRQRLVEVMHAVDGALRRKQAEVLELRQENAQLRQFLDTLLQAAEAGSDDRVGAAISDLDVAVAAFGGAPAPAAPQPVAEMPAPVAPLPDVPAASPIPDVSAPLDPAQASDALGEGAADLIDALNGEVGPDAYTAPPAPHVDGGEPAIPLDDDQVAELTALLDGEEDGEAHIDPVAIAEEAVRAATEAIESGEDLDAALDGPAPPELPAGDDKPTVREIMERVDKLSRELNPDAPAADTG